MNPLKRRRWNPYVVGIGIGILSCITFGLMHKALGTSTSIAKTPGVVIGIVAPEHVQANAYWAKYFKPDKGKVYFDWQFFLVIAMPIGAYLGMRLSDEKFKETVPPLWANRFGSCQCVRYTGAFVGGMILLFGARMAGGCTSGHGISGGLQLAVSSWAFFFAMFASGVVTAFALFGMKGRNHV
ncbi:MAG: YeeE/YedE family protein [Phycisphaeraceae bacterium]|nr:YeeE/YedE family protein [Phycisphaeraceae bacterium]